MGWIESISDAISYIEENITYDLTIQDIANKVFISPFYFQKCFAMLCGFTVSEYIKKRRLTLAGSELVSTNEKIIDIAMKYGYDSPDSFTKAFTRFHGVTPTAVRKDGAVIKSFASLKIKFTLEGGYTMEYKIVEKAAFTVMGKSRTFSYDNSYSEIPKFWQEQMNSNDKTVCGMYGVCLDSDNNGFEYLIADNYIPWDEVPEGYVTRTLPAGTWAVFPCRGALPNALQEVNTKIWKEWVPNCRDYMLTGNYSIEMYTPMTENPDDNYSEIWIPVKKK